MTNIRHFITLVEQQNDLLNKARALQLVLKANDPQDWADYQDPEIEDGGIRFYIRDWGEWIVPSDVEDDGDYDWKILSDKSSQRLELLIKKFEQENKVKVTVEGSEKSYLSFKITNL